MEKHTIADQDSKEINNVVILDQVPPMVAPFQTLVAPQKEAGVEQESFKIPEKCEDKPQKEGDSTGYSEIIDGNNNEEKSAGSTKLKRLMSLRDLEALDDAHFRFERDQRRRLALASWDWNNVISISDEEDEDDEFEVDEIEGDFPDSPDGPPSQIAAKPSHLGKRSRVLRVLDFSDDEDSFP